MPTRLNSPTMPETPSSLAPAGLYRPTLSVLELFDMDETLQRQGNQAPIVELYKAWIDDHPSDTNLFAVYFNYGVALSRNHDPDGAAAALRESIRRRPEFYPPYLNLGGLLEDKPDLVAAADLWMTVIHRLSIVNGETIGYRHTALTHLAQLLDQGGDLSGAEGALTSSLELIATDEGVARYLIFLRLRQCKWPTVEPFERIERKTLLTALSPFSLLHIADDPLFQLAKACRFNRQVIGIPTLARRKPGLLAADPPQRRKLRIGYVSADFKDHAGGFAMTEALELHDRERFEIFAYSCGTPRADSTQRRIRAAVDHWTELAALSDQEAADAIAGDDIDILVDLKGYTESARPKIFALRPAPVAVNWFGYPGTMGSPYHHYIIADDYVIPQGSEIYYSETVLRLPCYQPNDRHRAVSEVKPSRWDEGLPAGAVVFCCLNGVTKLTPAVFTRWMTILTQVPDGVLWLLCGHDDTKARLRQFAAQRGVAPERLIFATMKPNAEHLARLALADLFLDTFPCGAHTTAAESLWMGVPVLTVSGRGFAARVCGGVVTAAGVPELICDTPDAYVAKAIAYGRNRETLAALKKKLKTQRDSCLLFDTPALVRELETLYRRIDEDHRRGKRPVPNLENLDHYHDTGVGLETEAMEVLTTEAYHAAYRDRLEWLNDFSPIRPDGRLWT